MTEYLRDYFFLAPNPNNGFICCWPGCVEPIGDNLCWIAYDTRGGKRLIGYVHCMKHGVEEETHVDPR